MSKEKALIKFLGCTEDEVSEIFIGIFKYYNEEYLVVDEEERDEHVEEYIGDSLWSFTSSFLSSMTGLPEDIFIALQPQCESANDAIYEVVEQTCGLDKFIREAIDADGYGHFLSSYDGEENEQDGYYIYRVN